MSAIVAREYQKKSGRIMKGPATGGCCALRQPMAGRARGIGRVLQPKVHGCLAQSIPAPMHQIKFNVSTAYEIDMIVSLFDTIYAMTQLVQSLSMLVGPARGRLLQALRAGPDSGVHLRELARGAGLSLSSVQKELGRLSSLGVLKRTAKTNRVFHGLKRGDPFVRLLLAAATALELRGVRFNAMPSDRATEKTFVEFCAHFPPDAALWREFGDPEFLAGVAVMLAGHRGYERPAYLALAETLHAGASTPGQYGKWHQTHKPDFPRLFSMIDRERRVHARAGDQ